MRGTRIAIWAALSAVSALLFAAAPASAATLRGDYPLDGNLTAATPGAPALRLLGLGNRFATETAGGVTRRVLAFAKGGGLSLRTSGLLAPESFSLVTTFRLAQISSWRRIVDFSRGRSDNGIYDFSGGLDLYFNGPRRAPAPFARDTYAQFVVTGSPAPFDQEQTKVYVNGVQVASARTPSDFDLSSGRLRLFKDNTRGPGGEESAGAVDCLLVYDGALTPAEVEAIADRRGSCRAPSRPSSPGRHPSALAAGRPTAHASGRRTVLDTGLVLTCPRGQTCRGSASARFLGAGGKRRLRSRGAGRASFSLAGGGAKRVVLKLTDAAARSLRPGHRVKVAVAARIRTSGGEVGTARQTARVTRRAARPRRYRGVTSQGLPISLTVKNRSIRSVQFGWRARCADGHTHTNTIVLGGGRLHKGRFSVHGVLNTHGRAWVRGRVRRGSAWGKLGRRGPSAFGTDCKAVNIRWVAHRTRPPRHHHPTPEPLPGISYTGTTSQGLPISFSATSNQVIGLQFGWTASCDDGQTHTNTIFAGSGPIKNGGFTLGGTLNTGGHFDVHGTIAGATASGELSRSGQSAFDANCEASGVTWEAHVAAPR